MFSEDFQEPNSFEIVVNYRQPQKKESLFHRKSNSLPRYSLPIQTHEFTSPAQRVKMQNLSLHSLPDPVTRKAEDVRKPPVLHRLHNVPPIQQRAKAIPTRKKNLLEINSLVKTEGRGRDRYESESPY